MKLRRINLEYLLYWLFFLLGLAIRLVGAAHAPFTDAEAEMGFQALGLARGTSSLLGPHPAYLALTTMTIYLFGASTWMARFWPAVAGSLLALLPFLYRRRMGKLPALLLSFFFAFDPGLLAVSREASSLSLALFFAVLAPGLWLQKRPVLAGAAAGMALLCGPQIWPGLIAPVLAWGLMRLIVRKSDVPAQPAGAVQDRSTGGQSPLARASFSALITVFIAATLFFFIPNGLGALADSIPAYLRGWINPETGEASFVNMLYVLLVYEFFPLFFGVWGTFTGLRRGDSLDRFLVLWWAAALVLALAYPARQISSLAWSLLPLWALAARQVARSLTLPAFDRLAALGQAALSALIMTFLSMTLASVTGGSPAEPWEPRIRLAGAVTMLLASTFLIGWGWSRRVALRGLTWGIGIVLLVYLFAAGWNVSGLAGRSGSELWSNGRSVPAADLLVTTIGNLNQWGPVVSQGQDVAVVGISSPALRWALRDVQRISYTNRLPAGSSPAIVITPDQPGLSLAATYRGERFVMEQTNSWNKLQLVEWLHWVIFRDVPATVEQQDRIILWARTDLFPSDRLP